MLRVVQLELEDKNYHLFEQLAVQENRSLSNFAETAILRYLQSVEYVDEFETTEINNNLDLQTSLQRGIADAQNKRGHFL
jgi:hypothetical protein